MPTGHLTFYHPNARVSCAMTTSTYRCLRNVCHPRLPEEVFAAAAGEEEFNAICGSSGSSFQKERKKSVNFICTGEKPNGEICETNATSVTSGTRTG